VFMRAYRLAALSILSAVIVAGCAAHGSAVAPPIYHKAVQPQVDQPGSDVWVTLPTSPSVYGEEGIVPGFDDAMWYCEQINDVPGISKITMSGRITSYSLEVLNEQSFCSELAPNPDRSIYFLQTTESGNLTVMGHIWSDGQISYLTLSAPVAYGPVVSGSDGNLWILAYQSKNRSQYIYRVTPAGVVTAFDLGVNENFGEEIEGPDGNVWLGRGFAGREQPPPLTGKITPSGQITLYPNVGYFGLASGADGGVWYVSPKAMNRIDPATGAVTSYSTNVEQPLSVIYPGPGDDLYYIEPSISGDFHLRAFNVNSKTWTIYSSIPGTSVNGIADFAVEGVDHNVWLVNQTSLEVYLWREISTAPSSIQVMVGQSVPMSASVKHVTNATLSAASNDEAIATVSGSNGSFMIRGIELGSTTLTVSDNLGNSLNVSVTVN
jgi:hypothetical protein